MIDGRRLRARARERARHGATPDQSRKKSWPFAGIHANIIFGRPAWSPAYRQAIFSAVKGGGHARTNGIYLVFRR
jgi:hypothetical protein